MKMISKVPSSERVGLMAAVTLAVVARLVQYAANSSLHLDELALARSVTGRNFADLLGQPLAYDQVAPTGFLAPAA